MDPALAGALGGGLVVATLGLACALFAYGRSTRTPEVEARDGIIADLRATLDAERKRDRIRAAGRALDFARAHALDTAAGAGDLDGVLRQFPEREPGAAAGEPGEETAAGGRDDDPS